MGVEGRWLYHAGWEQYFVFVITINAALAILRPSSSMITKILRSTASPWFANLRSVSHGFAGMDTTAKASERLSSIVESHSLAFARSCLFDLDYSGPIKRKMERTNRSSIRTRYHSPKIFTAFFFSFWQSFATFTIKWET